MLVRYGWPGDPPAEPAAEFSGETFRGCTFETSAGSGFFEAPTSPWKSTLHPASFIETTDFDELIDKFIHTTLHATFHSVVEWTCREAELDRAEVWRIAARGSARPSHRCGGTTTPRPAREPSWLSDVSSALEFARRRS